MTQIAYNRDQLITLAGDLRNSKARLQETRNELESYVKGLVAQWQSGAQEAYSGKQAQWDSAHNEIMTILEAIAKAVEDGAISMAEQDAMLAATQFGG
ncbi:WXG100 family type VII secretion target [Nocardia sp. CDC159]|uniref:ESAT-6-like protein n=1 Tax=Nocardia pulmonis TaxID=2951408 RepID=A0A9X2E9K2_9NOCA|nr:MULTISPECIES: WXG100 family type VII secretion target [Nocardia]MCM6776135.1 WXG100 family type VII secretion target [Nocardia pulmonis]MCM6788538.1 WXG100 family type VII secretion target [Nocardia sp. CDC159]